MLIKSKQRSALAIVPILLLLTACASNPRPEDGRVDTETLDEDDGVVFGTIEVNYYNAQGKQLSGKAAPSIHYEVFLGDSENLGVKRAVPGLYERISISTQQPETFFAVKLPAGEYSIFKVQKPFPVDKSVTEIGGAFPADVRFTVAPKHATYIGSLQVNVRGVRGILGQERVGEKMAFTVVDKADAATKTYEQRNPEVKLTLGKGLMEVKRVR